MFTLICATEMYWEGVCFLNEKFVNLPMESREVADNAVGISLPDGEGVVNVPDVNYEIVVSDQHRLGSQFVNRIELVVQGVGFLSEKTQVKYCFYTQYLSIFTD